MDAVLRCPMKTKAFNAKKASKPLMEKKRRARINKCLDQLQSLLQNYYTHDARKRKLEKADILEMTVKYLRNFQGGHHGSITNAHFGEYQAGYKSCLMGVNRCLQATGRSSRKLRLNLLTRLCSSLHGAVPICSTADSGGRTCAQPETEVRIDSRLTSEEQKLRTEFNSGFHVSRGKGARIHSINTPSASKQTETPQETINLYRGNEAELEPLHQNVYSSSNLLTEGQNNVHEKILWRPW